MQTRAGVGLIVAGAALGLLVVFRFWRRLSGGTASSLVAFLGATVGAGALLLQDDPGAADWVVTLGLLAVGTPVHCRLAFGRPGPGDDARMVAAGMDGA